MLEGIVRESIGKSGTNALRNDGYLIANIYGKGLENISAAFKSNEYIRTVRKKDAIAFDVNVGGKELKVVVQSYESHPVTGNLLHVDLMVAQPGVVAKYSIPVSSVGDAVGYKNKGMLYLAKERLKVKGAIENIPNSIVIDITDMEVGDTKLIRDMTAIPNVKFTDADRVGVLSIIKAK
ncbi:MAG: 50S ribosomal protein L25/general stress protein Ctc [Helicobacteraceae bacterium]|nr:50S ribosomal protein L25/general stress protein Ctc [Helicobacteraceae bacterium]